MQAVILAGGEGTRLRPLTLSVPKPVMPLAGRPFLTFMLDWLGRHGVREATSLVLSARLQAAGAHVSAYDPIAEEEARRLMPGLEFADDALDCVKGADAVVLVTEWDEFKGLDWRAVAEAMAGDVLIDGRNALDPKAARSAGLVYEGIGRE